MAHISIFPIQGSSLTVLPFPCTVLSAGLGGPLGCFTQTLTPIACISFVDPNPASPLTFCKIGGFPFRTLPITHGRTHNWAVQSCALISRSFFPLFCKITHISTW